MKKSFITSRPQLLRRGQNLVYMSFSDQLLYIKLVMTQNKIMISWISGYRELTIRESSHGRFCIENGSSREIQILLHADNKCVDQPAHLRICFRSG